MSIVRDALIAEFKDLALKAKEYRDTIASAKTYAKREIFKKRLKENNIKAAEVLSALEVLMNKEAVGGANIDETNNEGPVAESSGTQTVELGSESRK